MSGSCRRDLHLNSTSISFQLDTWPNLFHLQFNSIETLLLRFIEVEYSGSGTLDPILRSKKIQILYQFPILIFSGPYGQMILRRWSMWWRIEVEECVWQLTTSLVLTQLFTRARWRNGFLLVMGKQTEKLSGFQRKIKSKIIFRSYMRGSHLCKEHTFPFQILLDKR